MIAAEDAFLNLYPHLAPEIVLNNAVGWLQDPAVEREIAAIDAQVRSTGSVKLPTVGPELNEQRSMFACAKGIERAFSSVHPRHGAKIPPSALADARTRRATTGRYNEEPKLGALVPRLATPARDTDDPDRLDLLFTTLHYVAPSVVADVEHVAVGAGVGVSRELRASGLVVATAPFIADADELAFDYPDRGGLRYYRVEVPEQAAVRDRATGLGRAIADSGAQLAFLPELTNATWLQEHWESVLLPHGARLQWAAMGTGDLAGPDHPKDPVNEMRLLDVATGDVLLRQRKIYRFDLQPFMVSGNYPLPGAPTGVELREDMHRGSPIAIAEMGAIRLAILICEDLARHEAVLHALFQFNVSHILAPVFSKPTASTSWEQDKGAAFVDGLGATVLVTNSLVLGRLKAATGPLDASLALNTHHPPAHAKADAATDLAVYVLHEDGAPELLS